MEAKNRGDNMGAFDKELSALKSIVAEHKYSGLTQADHTAQLVLDTGLDSKFIPAARKIVADFFNVGPTRLDPKAPVGTFDFIQDAAVALEESGRRYLVLTSEAQEYSWEASDDLTLEQIEDMRNEVNDILGLLAARAKDEDDFRGE